MLLYFPASLYFQVNFNFLTRYFRKYGKLCRYSWAILKISYLRVCKSYLRSVRLLVSKKMARLLGMKNTSMHCGWLQSGYVKWTLKGYLMIQFQMRGNCLTFCFQEINFVKINDVWLLENMPSMPTFFIGIISIKLQSDCVKYCKCLLIDLIPDQYCSIRLCIFKYLHNCLLSYSWYWILRN